MRMPVKWGDFALAGTGGSGIMRVQRQPLTFLTCLVPSAPPSLTNPWRGLAKDEAGCVLRSRNGGPRAGDSTTLTPQDSDPAASSAWLPSHPPESMMSQI